ncbi:MAG: FMN-binding protein [Gammaproteobacteria bacterium]|nr:FMN-binding protein [Gammaproteobacteria bacterium]
MYQSPEDFIRSSFDQEPETKTLWVADELAEQIKRVLGHDYHKLRLRYWTQQQRSAWILEEIGKELYITAGFVVENDSIQNTSILIFRESRGWEIQYEFFTEQFKGLLLTEKYELNKNIDNITGATLSVNAVKRLAKTALFLHRWVNKNNATP